MHTFFMKQLLYKYLLKDFTIDFSQIDCFALLTCAIEQKIEGLLYKRIYSNQQLDTLPKVIKKQLYINYVYNLQKNKIYLLELEKIKLNLCAQNIPIVPERGIYLIDNVYEDIAVRYMEDIDITAMLCDFEKIKAVLESYEYKLALVNDKKVTLPIQHAVIQSCLFVKTENLILPLPFVKIDILFVQKKDFYLHNSITEKFLRLCNSIYNSINIKNPSNCRLDKLFDIIYFIRQYPSIKTNVLNNKVYNNVPEIIYLKDCIDFYDSI